MKERKESEDFAVLGGESRPGDEPETAEQSCRASASEVRDPGDDPANVLTTADEPDPLPERVVKENVARFLETLKGAQLLPPHVALDPLAFSAPFPPVSDLLDEEDIKEMKSVQQHLVEKIDMTMAQMRRNVTANKGTFSNIAATIASMVDIIDRVTEDDVEHSHVRREDVVAALDALRVPGPKERGDSAALSGASALLASTRRDITRELGALRAALLAAGRREEVEHALPFLEMCRDIAKSRNEADVGRRIAAVESLYTNEVKRGVGEQLGYCACALMATLYCTSFSGDAELDVLSESALWFTSSNFLRQLVRMTREESCALTHCDPPDYTVLTGYAETVARWLHVHSNIALEAVHWSLRFEGEEQRDYAAVTALATVNALTPERDARTLQLIDELAALRRTEGAVYDVD